MPLSSQGVAQVPNYWTVFGHSYFQNTYGTRSQAGRADSIFRNLLNVDHTSFANFAVTGSRLTFDTASQGGYVRILQNVVPQAPGIFGNLGSAPYVAGGGSFLLAYGINDLGFNGNTAQNNAAYYQALRMAVSRCRMSALRDDDYSGSAGTGVITYGAGFTSSGFFYDGASGTTIHTANALTNANITITLPSDYNGETVTLSFITKPGVLGGVVTFSGTAGVTGTLSLSNILAVTSQSPVVQRIKTLTAANAGQTIIITVTSLDSGGVVQFDGYWLEADNPPPVLVCNVARLLAAGYATPGYTAIGDTDVNTFNAGLGGLLAEFDGMVQVVDIDSALNKDATLFSSDGLHPNELGAAKISDAILAAVRRLPANKWGTAASIQPPSPRTAAVVMPVISGQWYTSQCTGGANGGTNYTAVAGDIFAMPFEVTSGLSAWSQWCVELITSTVATSIYIGIYDDRRYAGYPQQLYLSPANVAGTPFPLTTGAGVKASPTSAGNGFLTRTPVDPGLYWLVIKIITAGTTTFRTLKGPSLWMPNLTTTGLGGTSPCGWKLTGQGTTQLTSLFPMMGLFGVVASDIVPMVGLLQS